MTRLKREHREDTCHFNCGELFVAQNPFTREASVTSTGSLVESVHEVLSSGRSYYNYNNNHTVVL
jgi:hypothetical protein